MSKTDIRRLCGIAAGEKPPGGACPARAPARRAGGGGGARVSTAKRSARSHGGRASRGPPGASASATHPHRRPWRRPPSGTNRRALGARARRAAAAAAARAAAARGTKLCMTLLTIKRACPKAFHELCTLLACSEAGARAPQSLPSRAGGRRAPRAGRRASQPSARAAGPGRPGGCSGARGKRARKGMGNEVRSALWLWARGRAVRALGGGVGVGEWGAPCLRGDGSRQGQGRARRAPCAQAHARVHTR